MVAQYIKDDVLIAQYRTLAKYLPFVYVITIINGMLVAAMYSTIAPATAIYPLLTLLTAISLIRLSYWLNAKLKSVTREHMLRTVRQSPYFAAFYFALLSYWVAGLLPHGTEAEQVTALMFLAFTIVSSIAFNTHMSQSLFVVVTTGSTCLILLLLDIGTTPALVLAALSASCILSHVVTSRHQNHEFLDTITQRFASEKHRQEAEAAKADLARIANTDPLTGIPNRRAFMQQIDLLIEGSQPFALGIMDLDGFKPVNDLYGHASGDIVLSTIAQRLQATVGTRGQVARLAGDEFGILVTDYSDKGPISELAEALVKSVDRTIVLEEGIVRVSACCGFASYPESSVLPSRLLEQADQALASAKRSGRSVVTLYNGEIENQEMRRHLVESRLRTAIVHRAFDLAFQPIRDLNDRAISSYEALARWQDDHLGHVSPAEFIPIAEQTGLINDLSDLLFQKAVKEAATWPSNIALSFNLSPIQFMDRNLLLKILSNLSVYDFPPHRLVLEITETAIIQDVPRAAVIVDQLTNAGIRVALDDFGVGYAGFGYLDRLTFDKLKIDRSFVSGIKDSVRKRQILTAIVDMCHRLDMKCVAEGIESEDELTFLKAIGCDKGQGYHLGRPGPPPDFATSAELSAVSIA